MGEATSARPDALIALAAERYGVTLSAAQRAQLVDYAALVHKWQRIANLSGATSTSEFVRAHVVDCLAAVPWLAAERLLDVGSGAGLPGIVAAVALPHMAVTLLEPRGKRARFLTQARIELALDNVEVVRERIEHHRPLHGYGCIVARAYASLETLLADTAAIAGPEVRIVAMRGRIDEDELTRLAARGMKARVVPLVVPGFAARTLVIVE